MFRTAFTLSLRAPTTFLKPRIHHPSAIISNIQHTTSKFSPRSRNFGTTISRTINPKIKEKYPGVIRRLLLEKKKCRELAKRLEEEKRRNNRMSVASWVGLGVACVGYLVREMSAGQTVVIIEGEDCGCQEGVEVDEQEEDPLEELLGVD